MEKINLDEILKQLPQYNIGTEAVFYHKQNVIAAMKEACRQTLELTAKKADIKIINHREHCPVPIVDKQSILDVINLIE